MAETSYSSIVIGMDEEPRPNSLKQCLKEVLEMDSILSRPFDTINQISVDREIWKLPVRIVNIWYEKQHLNEGHIEMVIMDSNCDRIQIVVPGRYASSWGAIFVEYQTYVFNNFKVEENDLLSRACQNPLKLVWFDGTFISNEIIAAIPNINFFFKDFREIQCGKFHPDDVHDIIGMVHEVTFHQRNENKVPVVNFVLKDNNRVLIECLLLGNHATTFVSGIKHDVGVEPNVVIIRNAIYHAAYETSPVSVGNASHGTRVFTDQSMAEIIDYKHSLLEHHEPVITIRIVAVHTQGLIENENDYSGINFNILRLRQLNSLEQELPCVSIGITNKINVSRFGWTFEGCAWCSKNVFVSEGVLKCSNDHVNRGVTPRYKLDIEVVYQQEKSTFLFSDPACANFFGISALELKRSLSVVDQSDARFYPLILDNLLGLKIVAKGIWSPTFESMMVESFSTDESLIDLIENKLP